LADVNAELVCAYLAVRDQPRDVIGHLMSLDTSRESFLRERELDPTKLVDARRAARFIYITKVGFNGLYRINRKGLCNVPWGQRPNARVCVPERILAASWALRDVEVRLGDFESTLSRVRPTDFVYADPPYVPATKGAFTSYQRAPFNLAAHQRLAALLQRLAAEGATIVATNSDCTAVRDLYAPFATVTSVPVTRRISASVASRVLGVTHDVLIHACAASDRQLRAPSA